MPVTTFVPASTGFPFRTPRRRRHKPPICSATPPSDESPSPNFDSDSSWLVLQRRLALLRDKEVIRDRTIARNWRSGHYKASIVAAVSSDYVRKLSLDSDLLAMGTASGAVVLADLVSGMRITCRDVHTGQVTAVHYRDSCIASAGSSDCDVAVWHVAPYEKRSFWAGRATNNEPVDGVLPPPGVRVDAHDDIVSAVRLDVSRRRVYSASVDGTVRASDVDTGKEIMVIRVGEPVLSMVLTENGYLLLGCASGRVQAYQAERGLYLLSMVCHKANTTAIDFRDDTQLMVTGDSAGNLSLWSFKDSAFLGSLPKHGAAVMSVQIDTSKVVSASRDGSVCVFGLDSLQRHYSIHGFTKYLASATFDEVRLIADGTNDLVVCHRFDADEGENP